MPDRPRPAVAALAEATGRFLAALTEPQRTAVSRPFTDLETRRRWTYLPGDRLGLSFGDLTRPQRKAVHAMLATVLRPHAYAQAATIMALEDVLDHMERQRLGRHNTDYWMLVFGDPRGDDPWGWHFEGHHVSVNIAVVGGHIAATPCFFGANPATVRHGGVPVLAPLTEEEHLARALLHGLTPVQRGRAVLADTAPPDIRTRDAARVAGAIEPRGLRMTGLDSAGAALLTDLLAVYLDRFLPEIGAPDPGPAEEIWFAWEGSPDPGSGHYYRIHAADLLIEYDNTANDANHVHSVIRRPAGDFGMDLLTRHHEREPHPSPAHGA